jgi:hypothetical protein
MVDGALRGARMTAAALAHPEPCDLATYAGLLAAEAEVPWVWWATLFPLESWSNSLPATAVFDRTK